MCVCVCVYVCICIMISQSVVSLWPLFSHSSELSFAFVNNFWLKSFEYYSFRKIKEKTLLSSLFIESTNTQVDLTSNELHSSPRRLIKSKKIENLRVRVFFPQVKKEEEIRHLFADSKYCLMLDGIWALISWNRQKHVKALCCNLIRILQK